MAGADVLKRNNQCIPKEEVDQPGDVFYSLCYDNDTKKKERQMRERGESGIGKFEIKSDDCLQFTVRSSLFLTNEERKNDWI